VSYIEIDNYKINVPKNTTKLSK